MKQLKTKFIILTMTALLILLVFMVAGMNVLNYNTIVQEADTVLSVLSGNKGRFPDVEPGDKLQPQLPPEMSPEIPYESRFFSVSFNGKGEVTHVDVNKIAAVDESKAVLMARQVKEMQGFTGSYRYAVSREAEGLRVTFLDCGRKLASFQHFLYSSILMSLLGYAAVFAAVFVLAGKIIRPIAESYEKQKRFITDAGHEIKTPLTIINANADLLEMELGENESLADIKTQARRLKNLTEDLVMLSRMEEAEQSVPKIDFPISEVVEEATHDFIMLAQAENKALQCQIEPMLTCKGDSKSIGQLVSILLDNAIKYSPSGTVIHLQLIKQGHSIQLSVTNATQMVVSSAQLQYVFDRFYRTDSSRSSETGGHGIGLSIAKAIVAAHGGKIKAYSENEETFGVIALFPV